MKRFVLLLGIVPLLTACPWEEKSPAAIATPCYDIINTTGQPNQAILLNKCTGETWIALRETEPKAKDELTPSFTYRWYKIQISSTENSVAGIKSSY